MTTAAKTLDSVGDGQPVSPASPAKSAAPAWKHAMWVVARVSADGEPVYVMTPYCPRRPIDQKSLGEVVGLWRAAAPEPLSLEAFDREACTDWDAMDGQGRSVCASREAREANGRALAALPYPAVAVLYALRYLCPRRCESAARVADWLAWVRAEAQAALGVDLPLVR